jgi:hypothetical protein
VGFEVVESGLVASGRVLGHNGSQNTWIEFQELFNCEHSESLLIRHSAFIAALTAIVDGR